jgi:hypothetical protein
MATRCFSMISLALACLCGVCGFCSGADMPQRVMRRYKIDLKHLEKEKYLPKMRIEYLADQRIERDVKRKFTDKALAQVEAEAERLYPYFERGKVVHVTVGWRNVTGVLTQIRPYHVMVDGILISRRDLPETAFDKQLADRLQKKYLRKNFFKKKDRYEAKMARRRDKIYAGLMRENGYVYFENEWITTRHAVRIWDSGEFPEQSHLPDEPDEIDDFDDFDDFGGDE